MNTEKQVLEHIKQAKELWIKACEYDKVDPKSSFVVFSDNNPFVKEGNEKRLENNGVFCPGYATQVEIKYLEDNGYIYKKVYDTWIYYNDEGITVFDGPHRLEITKNGKRVNVKDSIEIL